MNYSERKKMSQLEQNISKLLQAEQPITESEAQDLASMICELFIKEKTGERKLILNVTNYDNVVLFENLNDFEPLEFIGILHNAISTADVLYKTKVMKLVEEVSKKE